MSPLAVERLDAERPDVVLPLPRVEPVPPLPAVLLTVPRVVLVLLATVPLPAVLLPELLVRLELAFFADAVVLVPVDRPVELAPDPRRLLLPLSSSSREREDDGLLLDPEVPPAREDDFFVARLAEPFVEVFAAMIEYVFISELINAW